MSDFVDTASVFTVESIPEERLVDNCVFPLTLGVDPERTIIQALEWLKNNHGTVDNLLRKHRAILFRGITGLKNHDDFHRFIEALDYVTMDYIGGAAVRTQLTSRVFTANESPSSEKIPFHHEMAQTPHPPTHLYFFCENPPSSGGETPILVSNEIYRLIAEKYPEEMKMIESIGVKYVRIMPRDDDPTSAIGRGWRSTFLCDSKEEAEEALRKLGSTWEWLENGDLKTITAILPAIKEDSGEMRSNVKTFFNSLVAAYTGWNDSRNQGCRAVLRADGLFLNPDMMNDAVRLMDEVAVAFPWQAGDVLLLDNRTAMHSRKPFEGPRRILASLARDQAR